MQTVWARAYRGQKTIESQTGQCNDFDLEAVKNTVRQICEELDISQPVWLRKHQNDIINFRRTTFKPGDFIESVRFDRFEIEIYEEPVFFRV